MTEGNLAFDSLPKIGCAESAAAEKNTKRVAELLFSRTAVRPIAEIEKKQLKPNDAQALERLLRSIADLEQAEDCRCERLTVLSAMARAHDYGKLA